MTSLQVNQELCTRCGVCSEVCPTGVLDLENAGPKLIYPPGCIACGHCVAACPEAALDHPKAPLANQTPLEHFPVLEPFTAAAFLRSRRSIRSYRNQAVPKEKILELLEIARFAPTGGNSQGLSYLVIDNPLVLKEITGATVDWMEEQMKSGAEWGQRYASVVSVYRKTGADVILRGAPCLIVATAPAGFAIGHDNARFALEYVELYATALGLGTCWAGFVEICAASNFAPLREAMKLPAGTVVAGAMMVGYPKYAYRRLVDRNPLKVSWLE